MESRKERSQLLPRGGSVSIRIVISLMVSSFTLSACTSFQELGDAYTAAGEYDAACGAYARAEKEASARDLRLVLSKLAAVRNRQLEVLVAGAQGKLGAGDAWGAIDAVEERRAEETKRGPSDSCVVARVLAERIVPGVLAAAKKMAAAEKFAEAVQLLSAADVQLPAHGEATKPVIDEVLAAWVVQLERRARMARAANRKADALLHYAKIATLTGSSAAIARRDDIFDELRDKHAFTVALRNKDGSMGTEDVLRRLADLRTERLLKVLPPTVATVPAKATLEVSLTQPKFTNDASRGVHSVRYNFATRRNEKWASAHAKTIDLRIRLVDYESELTRETKKLEACKKEASSSGFGCNSAQTSVDWANEKFQRHRKELLEAEKEENGIPPTVDEIRTHNFFITTHKRTASSRLRVDVLEQGKRARQADLPVTSEASDVEHPAEPIASVPEDPLRLPPPDQQSREIQSIAAARVKDELDRSFHAYSATFVARVRSATSDDERVEAIVLAMLVNPSNVDGSMVDTLARLRGIPDSVSLLRKR